MQRLFLEIWGEVWESKSRHTDCPSATVSALSDFNDGWMDGWMDCIGQDTAHYRIGTLAFVKVLGDEILGERQSSEIWGNGQEHCQEDKSFCSAPADRVWIGWAVSPCVATLRWFEDKWIPAWDFLQQLSVLNN
jgi:hypothetical protein